jgi:hypothetical protein
VRTGATPGGWTGAAPGKSDRQALPTSRDLHFPEHYGNLP